jgi:hypothetical protein
MSVVRLNHDLVEWCFTVILPSWELPHESHFALSENRWASLCMAHRLRFPRQGKPGWNSACFFSFSFWNPIYCLVPNFISTYATPLAPNGSSAPASLSILSVCQLAYLVILCYCLGSRKYEKGKTLDSFTRMFLPVDPLSPRGGMQRLVDLLVISGQYKFID